MGFNLFKRRRRKTLNMVAGSISSDAIEKANSAAQQEGVTLHVQEAYTADGIYRAAEKSQLLVVNWKDVQPGSMTVEEVQKVLEGIPTASEEEFLNNPAQWIREGLAFAGDLKSLPPTVIAFASMSGGVGKTTLAMATARRFTERSGLPSLLIELSQTASALKVLIGDNDIPSLYAILTQGAAPARWHGVSVVPSDWQVTTLLNEDSHPEDLLSGHILTVLDVNLPYPLWNFMAQRLNVKTTFVPFVPCRPDTLAVALDMRERVIGRNTVLVVNQGSKLDALSLKDIEPFVVVPKDSKLSPKALGDPILSHMYWGWRL